MKLIMHASNVQQCASFLIEYNIVANALRNLNIDMTDGDSELMLSGQAFNTLLSRDFKTLLVKNKYEVPRSQVSWSAIYENLDWPSIWNCAVSLKLDARVTTLQWKILQQVYPTHILLQNMGEK
jgi:hypothetical protein